MTDNPQDIKTAGWLDWPVTVWFKKFDAEKAIFLLLIILAIISRFSLLGARVMSHDEVNHVRPSWELFEGQGYRHDPVTHGPMQFHLVALAYTLFGDTDFNSRLPAALFSIATVWMVWKYRRYLGRTGGMLATGMMLISPYMLFYGRYTRNEAFVALFGVITLYLMLRYLEEPNQKYLLGLAAVFSLQFVTKETSYIYAAQALLFLLILFIKQLFQATWTDTTRQKPFMATVLVGGLLIIAALAIRVVVAEQTPAAAAPSGVLGESITMPAQEDLVPPVLKIIPLVMGGFGILGILAGGWFLFQGLGLEGIRKQRSFDLLILIGTMVLPQLTAFPIKELFKWNPLDYSGEGMLRTGIVLLIVMLVSVIIGIWWNWKIWIRAAGIFYTIYVFLYTTMFTNGQGFYTGIIGSLGYWLEQQGVQRGSQPLYFYAGIQIPIYEFLPAIGSIIALVLALIWLWKRDRLAAAARFELGEDAPQDVPAVTIDQSLPVWLLIFWSFTSLVAYSIAGEKMPWLTVHIAWPMILTAGWGFGRLVTRVNWTNLFNPRGWVVILSSLVGVIALGRLISALNTTPLPFAGNELDQLNVTSTFLFTIVMLIGSAVSLYLASVKQDDVHIGQIFGIAILFGLTVLTVRASFRANYINYDSAKEYLVYAHAARGPKDILKQVEEISQRMTSGKKLRVGYDNASLYPYWWYLRDFSNLDYFAEKPSKAIREDDIVLVGNPNYDKVEPILNKSFYSFEYVRLWWPNQDYFNLDGKRLWNAISDPNIRAGMFQIWLNRDYSKYAEAIGSTSMTDESWEPAERIKMYIRKDLAAKIWNYGTVPLPEQVVTDPYEQGLFTVIPDVVVGSNGAEAGMFNGPRGIATAADGTLYVADSRNHRIQHFTKDGQFISAWGTFADSSKGDAPGGTFNEPWGIAVGPDGSVFVADTWNHRVQKFSAEGKFISMWGYFGQAEQFDGFWGPRGIAVDSDGRVYVTDTGNKRVVVFDSNGTGISSFGSYGLDPGQFDEPVGIAVDQQGLVYVADTWNQRIQVFTPDTEHLNFALTNQWDITGWVGQSLENKPYLAVDSSGNVFVADPEGYRVLEFDNSGKFLRTWGEYSTESDGFGLASAVAVDGNGGVWVSDALNGRVMHFVLP